LKPPTWEAFLPPALSGEANSPMRPLPLPLQMSGFNEHAMSLAQRYLSPLGFIPVRSGSGGQSIKGLELVPGAPVAAVLLSGDMSIAATGTVTYRKDNQVLAFGHPFFDNGPIELPMAQSHIITTISSALASQKLGLTGKIVGALRQDRTTGIMGVIGPIPAMTDVKMAYMAEDGSESRFEFAMAREKTLSSIMPLVLRIALISALESARLSTGENSLALKGTIELEDGRIIRLDNLYPGYQPLPVFSFLNSILHSTGQIAATLAAITTNPFRRVNIKRLELSFQSVTGRQSAKLQSIWVNRATFQPGDTVEVSYRLRPYRGKPFTEKQKIVIPASIRSRYVTLVVGGGPSLAAFEKRLTPTKFIATSYNKLIRLLQEKRRNDRLYIQLRVADRGLIINGEELPGLPPSILPVMDDRSAKNSSRRTRDRVIVEVEIPQNQMVEGIQTVRLSKQ